MKLKLISGNLHGVLGEVEISVKPTKIEIRPRNFEILNIDSNSTGLNVKPSKIEIRPRIVDVASIQTKSDKGTPMSCGRRVTLDRGDVYQVTSPGYPNTYTVFDSRCRRTFDVAPDVSMVITCRTFQLSGRQINDLRCLGDKLTMVYNGQRVLQSCGNTLEGREISGFPTPNEGYVFKFNFVTAWGRSNAGFDCSIQGIGVNEGPTQPPPTTVTTAKPSTQNSTSGSGPTTTRPAPVAQGCQCGQAVAANRIVDGQTSSPNSIPWQVGLVSGAGNVPFCGGTLISSRHVLTAAHCTGTPDLSVVLGEHNIKTTADQAQRVKVARIIDHPSYNSVTFNNDFAILELAKDVAFNNQIKPSCLPVDGSTKTYTGVDARVSGWGLLEYNEINSIKPQFLQETTLKVVSDGDCRAIYGIQAITDRMLCAYAKGTDSCQGDSGGPLTTLESNGRHTVIGVVSFGSGCAQVGVPGVYARVTSVLPWIKQNAANAQVKICQPSIR
eukprot:maker-scaffold91_size383040-snap-gene-2.26 protein:Tk03190 transcript:maker-scaffold91_size383040-snap-gene-2.26-mRNA-1 annotation:"serine protease 27-like"